MQQNSICVEPEIERAIWRLFRDFFDKAEKKRRWLIRDDIPWNQCNEHLSPAHADIVESFCAVELYLPDYTAKVLPMVRPSMGRTWFYANWGYEESKHSIALRDWLLKSKQRSDEQMEELERNVFQREWNLPQDNHLGMLVYAMVQELATWLNYRNLRQQVALNGGDRALETLLDYVCIDERAHYHFFLQCVELFLKHHREETLEQLRRVMNGFQMPAVHDLLHDGAQRIAAIKKLGIFDESMYYSEIYLPLLQQLGVDRQEMRNRVATRKSAKVGTSAPAAMHYAGVEE